MNYLSWLVYIADVSEALGTVSATLTILSGLICGFGIICYAIGIGSGDTEETWWVYTRSSLFRIGLPFFVVSGLVYSFVPSRDTVLLIAASEVGEEIVTSETTSKTLKVINQWLDQQLIDEAVENEGE